jgi:hypothetical protein
LPKKGNTCKSPPGSLVKNFAMINVLHVYIRVGFYPIYLRRESYPIGACVPCIMLETKVDGRVN